MRTLLEVDGMAIANRPQEIPIEEILDDLQPRMSAVLAKFRIPRQDADDVLQQTLLTYLHKRESIHDPERWLLGTLRNRCLVYWRSRRRRLYDSIDKALLESVAESGSAPQESADFMRDLDRLVNQLPERCQTIFQLRYREGFDASEAAHRLGYKSSSIYKVTERCMAALTRGMLACGLIKGSSND